MEPHYHGALHCWLENDKKKPSWVRELVDWQKQEQKVNSLALNELLPKAADKSVNNQKDEIENRQYQQ